MRPHQSWIGRLVVLASAVALCLPVAAADHKELKAFPPAKEGMKRLVIVLPHKERGEEDAFKVEIVAGKTMLTDGVNRMRLGTAIEARPLKGWGYTYYDVTGSGHAMSTMMAPPPGTPKVKRFVAGTSLTIRYNSRLPIVVYAPPEYELRYRIWKAPQRFETVNNG
ncbi:MAG: proteinase inhibitor I4 serpin [Verrucomicrobia bacterium]|jgi:ecotin|nr:proteinase inhibitor I4 serpin [Verrucomicrobiota bacterium]MBT7065639.1 proteinase inhibitor I4 serpin [Verrucomicrobiota bacterium]MBT7700200.1 proteinase inhibitor I4 serpin [Verrucomicrobiota bacterium]